VTQDEITREMDEYFRAHASLMDAAPRLRMSIMLLEQRYATLRAAVNDALGATAKYGAYDADKLTTALARLKELTS